MSYWPLDTPYRPATVTEAPRQILSQLASMKVLLQVDILIMLQEHKACLSRISVDRMQRAA